MNAETVLLLLSRRNGKSESIKWLFEALKKTIPINAGVLRMNSECPVCGKPIKYKHNYCPECGQRLKWTEVTK